MRVVHVRVSRPDFPKTLGDMREWLDANDCRPLRFETQGDGISITIKVQFEGDDLAERFRQAFRGSYGD